MELPILDELRDLPTDQEELTSFLSVIRLGERPLYLDITYLSADKQEKIIQQLKTALLSLNFSPLPYPFYVVTPLFKNTFPLTPIRKRGELPAHFRVKKRKISTKEEALLRKIDVLRQRITSHHHADLLQTLNDKLHLRRKTKIIANQIDFLSDAIKRLKSRKAHERLK